MIPGLVAHLWQSTLFAAAAWLLTLVLRRNAARVRYWILFIASMKFLIPFALLVGLGTLVPLRPVTPPVQTAWVAVAEQIGQPLIAVPTVATRVAIIGGRASRNYVVAAALALWVCGFAVIMICWLNRWRRVRALRISAVSMRIPALELAVPVVSAPGLVEPGVFGIFRPVLLLPQGIWEQFEPAQLDAILAHELCHVRRRDNLTATIHMAVQAIFWFHPLIWWVGARLVDERERACDEDVLRLGCKPQVYAAGILNVCKLYVETPLACVSGVTGADLNKRIEAIMKNRIVRRLDFTRKAALALAATAALVVPVAIGVMNAPAIRAQSLAAAAAIPRFEVASVKPTLNWSDYVSQEIAAGRTSGGGMRISGNHVDIDSMSMLGLISKAYRFDSRLIVGPDWVHGNEASFAVHALMPEGTTAAQIPDMMRALLEERFHLTAHRVVADQPAYALSIGKNGPKLKDPGDPDPSTCSDWVDGPVGTDNRSCRGSKVIGDRTVKMLLMMKTTWGPMLATWSANERHEEYFRITMADLVDILKQGLSPAPGIGPAPVPFLQIVDRTGIEGPWHVALDTTGGLDERLSSYAASLERQGLRLERTTASVEKLIIDNVDRAPTEN